MKRPDIEKETKCVELFAITGNATDSARKSGYEKNPSQMGYYLKDKLRNEIEKYRADVLFDYSGNAITKLKQLMDSESDNVKLNACKLILDITGYSADQNINLKTSKSEYDDMSDEQLAEKIVALSLQNPFLKKKLLDS